MNLHLLEPPQCLISSTDRDNRGLVIPLLVYVAEPHFKVCKKPASPHEDVISKFLEQISIATRAKGELLHRKVTD